LGSSYYFLQAFFTSQRKSGVLPYTQKCVVLKFSEKSEQQHLCPIFKNKHMKKIVLLLVLIVANMSLISCNKDAIVETDSIYENLAGTEGDDGEIEKDPDAEETGN
jgi:hypothetical protein